MLRVVAAAQVGRARPGDPEVPKMLARVNHRMGNAQAAIEVLEKYLQDHPGGQAGPLAELRVQPPPAQGVPELHQAHAVCLDLLPGCIAHAVPALSRC